MENSSWDCPVLRTDKAGVGFDYWAVVQDRCRAAVPVMINSPPYLSGAHGHEDVIVSPTTSTPTSALPPGYEGGYSLPPTQQHMPFPRPHSSPQPLLHDIRVPLIGLLSIRPRVDVWYPLPPTPPQQQQQQHHRGGHKQSSQLSAVAHVHHAPLYLAVAAAQLLRWHTDLQLANQQQQQQQQQLSSSADDRSTTRVAPHSQQLNAVRSHNSSPMSYTGSIGGESTTQQTSYYNATNVNMATTATTGNPVLRHMQGYTGYSHVSLGGGGDAAAVMGAAHYGGGAQQQLQGNPAGMVMVAGTATGSLVMTSSASRNSDLWNVLKHERHIQDLVRAYA